MGGYDPQTDRSRNGMVTGFQCADNFLFEILFIMRAEAAAFLYSKTDG